MKQPQNFRPYAAWIWALVFAFTACLTAAASEPKGHQDKTQTTAPASVAGAKYVGSDTCKGCHEDQFKKMQSTPHYHVFGAQKNGVEGCESCHGAGSLHVEGGGDKSKIIRFSEMKPEEQSRTCLQCHSKKSEQAHFERSVHNRAGVGCTTCHSVHAPKVADHLLTAKQPDLCFGCHAETKADFMKPFRHRVMEGLITCADCHNVHGTTTDKQLRNTASQEQVCLKCHTDLRGPFVFEHEPVKVEGCATCHTPHGSSNPRMIETARVNSLCLQCHQNFYNAPHPQNTKSQACTMCHTAIHGSNTSNVLFKR